ncbi:MAG: DUF1445 domain-containing protein [Burkholderiales bacterium]|nr:DUF1445 domain-containing protein [Burkholderiales bacterium]
MHIGKPELDRHRGARQPRLRGRRRGPGRRAPVFPWACGVTPQAVIAAAAPEFAITHAPGCMLVTDLKNARLSIL